MITTRNFGKPLEHTFEDQARQTACMACATDVMLLHVIGRPAAAGGWMAVGATDMDRDRQVVAHGGLEDRPVAAPSERLVGPWQNQDLREIRIACPRIDFGDGGNRVFLRNQYRGPQARLLLHPALDLPGVHRPGQRHAEVEISLAAGIPAQRNQHPDFDAVRIEMLLPHQVQARTRRPALLRIGIDPRRVRRHARMRQRLGKRVAQVAAIDRKMLDPLPFADRDALRSTTSSPDGCRNR